MAHGHEWVSQEFENLAHVLNDYDHNLYLEMVPSSEWDNLVDKTKVFRVIDTARNKVVLYASAIDSPTDILARVWSMDQTHNKVVTDLDARNRAAQALLLNKHAEEMEEQKELALFIIKNKKSTWHHDGRVRVEHFRDKGPIRRIIT
jgi:hypothetical protein